MILKILKLNKVNSQNKNKQKNQMTLKTLMSNNKMIIFNNKAVQKILTFKQKVVELVIDKTKVKNQILIYNLTNLNNNKKNK